MSGVAKYAKLSCGIVESSLWELPSDACKLWMTVLALKNLDGVLEGNIHRLRRASRLPLEVVEQYLKVFESPDPESTTTDYEGRRLLPVPGGWRVVNADKYQELGWSEDKKRYERERKQQYRDSKKDGVAGKSDPVAGGNGAGKPEEENGGDEVGEAFELFWAAYPKKKARIDARKAFETNDCVKVMSKIMESLKAFVVSPDWTKDGGQYIPYPATWIRDHRWEDSHSVDVKTNGHVPPPNSPVPSREPTCHLLGRDWTMDSGGPTLKDCGGNQERYLSFSLGFKDWVKTQQRKIEEQLTGGET